MQWTRIESCNFFTVLMQYLRIYTEKVIKSINIPFKILDNIQNVQKIVFNPSLIEVYLQLLSYRNISKIKKNLLHVFLSQNYYQL